MIRFKLEEEVYAGSKLFTPMAEKIGVPIDKLNFLIAQLIALSLAILYRSFLSSPNIRYTNLRYLVVLVPGFLLGYFEFGYQIWNLWILSMVCYILMLKCNPNIVQDLVLFVSIFYLSYLHLKRQINSYGSYIVDITVPSMIVVQKLTSLAFSVHDGMSSKKSLTNDQQRFAVTQMPSLLQYFAYIFQFHTVLSGPMLYFNDFTGFIEGTIEQEYLNDKKSKNLPSYKLVVLKKLAVSSLFLVLYLFVEPLFPISRIYDDQFLNNSNIFQIMFYIYLSTTCQRFKYYHAWKLGEAIAISCGMGLVKNDLNEFEYISSVDIIGFELATNFRSCLIAWNITTQNWLRRVSYERSKTNKVVKTYILSAIWHGFYFGYYLTFLSGALLTNASRIVRRHVRPYFQINRSMQLTYNGITFLVTKIVLAYIVFPFVLLEFTASMKIYSRLWFGGHIILILICLTPMLMKSVVGGPRMQNQKLEKSN